MNVLAAAFIGPLLVLAPTEDASKPETSAAKADKHLLAYKFQKGDIVHYEVTQATTRNSRLPNQVQIVKDHIHEFKHLEVVESRDDGSFILQTVFDRVVMEVDFGSQKSSFDSQKPKKNDPPGFNKVRKRIAKPRFQLHMKPTGELIAIRRLASAGFAAEETAMKDADGSSTFVVFPSKPLKVGGTWREEYTLKIPVSKEIVREIQIFRTYRLNSVKDGIAKLSFATSLKTPVKSPAVLAQLIQATPSGTVEFDIEAGQLVSRTIKVDKMVINPSGPQSMLKTASRRVEKRVQPTAAKEPAESAE